MHAIIVMISLHCGFRRVLLDELHQGCSNPASEATTTLNGERRWAWLSFVLRWTGLSTLCNRSNQQSQSKVIKMMMLLGRKNRGIMLHWRWHIPLKTKKWQTTTKNFMAFIKNTIEQAIVGSIAECDSVGEYLKI
jgi:hypothetical protein